MLSQSARLQPLTHQLKFLDNCLSILSTDLAALHASPPRPLSAQLPRLRRAHLPRSNLFQPALLASHPPSTLFHAARSALFAETALLSHVCPLSSRPCRCRA